MNQQRVSLIDIVCGGLFWSWNVIFLAFMVLGFAPRLLPELLTGVRLGYNPVGYLIFAVLLSLAPVAAVVLGVTALRGQPRRLFALGYVVEGPLMLLMAVRFFVIRQASPALSLLMILAGLGMLAFLWLLLDQGKRRLPAGLAVVRLAGLTLMLLVSLYAAAWIAFYAVPLFGAFWQWWLDTVRQPGAFWRSAWEFIRELFRENLLWLPFSVLGFLLLLYTSTLFVLTPIAVPVLSVRMWWRDLRALARRLGWGAAGAAAVLAAAAAAAVFVLGNRQPQQRAFALLTQPPATVQAARALAQQEKAIRAGLLNAYLAPVRYISAVGEVAHVRGLYQSVLKMDPEDAAAVERLYYGVARPLLYDPVEAGTEEAQRAPAFQREPLKAARLYQRYFDVPIAEAERSEIVRAARQTWSPEMALTAWQEVDEREVLLAEQHIGVTEHGDWAEIELMEVYRNQTFREQEVVYYFNLPETAVLTGLWLGTSPERAQANEFQVAPRGAAQQVYNEQKVVRRDPALLEQIGPRQYRLRVFPVPPKVPRWETTGGQPTIYEGAPLYLWMTYRTLPTPGAPQAEAWPLPRLAYHRNVYWDGSTRRVVNGREVKSGGADWLPAALGASQPLQPKAHRADFAGGVSVVAAPASDASADLPRDVRLAVVLDRSRSMEAQRAAVSAALERMRQLAAQGAQVDVYLTASSLRGEAPQVKPLAEMNEDDLFFFGGQNPADLLIQYEELAAGRSYDGVLVLTDNGAYELGPRSVRPGISPAPVWLVHLGSGIPLGYDDPTLEAVQASGGGVAGGLEEALLRLGAGLEGQDVVDGYRWWVTSTAEAAALAPDALVEDPDAGGFAALLARRRVLAEIHARRGTIGDPATLDQIHALAQQVGMVTPYSSMIVLVNDMQRRRLEALAADEDRYQREWEAQNAVPSGSSPLTGVPEPEEWLLILSALGVLAWYLRKRFVPQVRPGIPQ